MAIYAIADLHLSHAEEKSMDIFGVHWAGHWQKIQAAWRARITEEDLVLIPGDISWAMHMPEAQPDLDAIGAMPGQKLILRGNHDYWWSSLAQVRAALKKGMFALQNDCFAYRGAAVCGTRGWVQGNAAQGERDAKLYQREVGRLRLSLQSARDKGLPVSVVMFHYPPFDEKQTPNEMTAMLKEFGVKRVVYGHLHGKSLKSAFEGTLDGIRYELVSCDHLQFAPKLILP